MGKQNAGSIITQETRRTPEKPTTPFSASPNEAKKKLSFEDELTFAPKLNSLSMRIAEINRTSIIRRRKQKKKNIERANFLFKPIVCDKTNEIAAKFKTGFWDRQNLHAQHKKQMLEQDPSTVHPNLRASTSIQNKLPKVGKQENGFTTPEPHHHEPKTKSPQRVPEEVANNTLQELKCKKLSDKQSNRNKIMISPRKAKHEKGCAVGTKNLKDVSSDKLEKVRKSIEFSSSVAEKSIQLLPSKKHRMRSLTFPQCHSGHEEMDEKHQQLIQMKKLAEKAVKNKKVFVCNGPYSVLRSALRKRGWIEKFFKNDACVRNTDFDEEGDKIDRETKANIELLSDNDYGIMSRIVRNSTPYFIWTLKRDDVDFRFLKKDQMVNHYMSAWAFTTKAALCSNLRNVHYFDDRSADVFFPRCYRICCNAEKEEFIDDFRLTAVVSTLKLIVLKHQEWKEMELNLNKDKDDTKTEELVKNMSKRSGSRSGKVKTLPATVLKLITKACYSFLDSKEHLDIEEDYVETDRDINNITWPTIIDNYYLVAHGNAIILDAWMHLAECEDILNKMRVYLPQIDTDGHRNIWILKPGAKSRGRGIEMKNRLNEILSLTSDTISGKENKWVVQKYIEQPYLIYGTKFDIRQWFLVTDWNPLVVWFYKDCYIRFCGQEYTLTNFSPQFHLSNNSIQKHYEIGKRSEHLPDSNMWSSDKFKEYLVQRGHTNQWESVIYDGMKKAVTAALQSCQDSLEYRKNSFELYGADFMLCENLKPWLIEINSSPALGASTDVTEHLCRNVIEDTLKVVLDRRDNKLCDVGRFEIAYKQQTIAVPAYMGCNIAVDGLAIKNPCNQGLRLKFKPKQFMVEKDSAHVKQIVSGENTKTGLVQSEITKSDENLPASDTTFVSDLKPVSIATPSLTVLRLNTEKIKEVNETLKGVASEISAAAEQANGTSVLPVSLTIGDVISSDVRHSKTQYHGQQCYNCGGTDEPIFNIATEFVETYDIRSLTSINDAFVSCNAPSKKERRIQKAKSYKQFGILAAEEITGLKKHENLSLDLLTRYDTRMLQELQLKPGYGIRQSKY